MARFFSRRIVHPETGHVYEIELGIDRLATLRDSLSVDIVARRHPSLTAAGAEISATLTLDPERHRLKLEIEGEEVGEIDLDTKAVPDADLSEGPEAPEGFTGRAWAAVRDSLVSENTSAADAVEGLIEALPAFDPVLGCLLKGGISAAAGQIIRCYQDERSEDEIRRRLRKAAQCLGRNAWSVLSRGSWRAFKCIGTLGFG